MVWNAIGVVEVSYYSNSIVVMDSMLKAADVEICGFEKKLGGKMTQSIIAGETSAVNASIAAAERTRPIIGEQSLKVAVCISNPHPEVIKMLNMMNFRTDKF